MAITDGTYSAKATGECVLGESNDKGTPFLEVNFKILNGPNQGGTVRWTGYFTENTSERTIQSLQYCGWEGDDLSEFADGKLHGIDRNEVSIEVKLESYKNKDGEDRTAPRVSWVNRAGGFLNKEAAMNEGAAAAFGARMRGLVHKTKEKNPQPKPGPAKTSSTPARGSTRDDDMLGSQDGDPDAIPF